MNNVSNQLDKTDRYIQKELDMIQTTTRRSKTEWYKNEKIEIVDVFLRAFAKFNTIGGQIENPAFKFRIFDANATEKAKNTRERRRLREAANKQLERMKREYPADYDFLTSCANWTIERPRTALS